MSDDPDVVWCLNCNAEVHTWIDPDPFCSEACSDQYDRETWPEEYEDESASTS